MGGEKSKLLSSAKHLYVSTFPS